MNREQGSCSHIVQTWETFCPKSKWCLIAAMNRTTRGRARRGGDKTGFIIIKRVTLLSPGKK